MRSNASFKHLDFVNIVSQLEIHVCFCTGFFCKSIKKGEPKYEERLPYNNTQGLANVMRL